MRSSCRLQLCGKLHAIWYRCQQFGFYQWNNNRSQAQAQNSNPAEESAVENTESSISNDEKISSIFADDSSNESKSESTSSESAKESTDNNKSLDERIKFYKGDIRDEVILNKIFDENKIDACIHFAGLKAVGESDAKPWLYYNNNIGGTLNLIKVLDERNCKNIIRTTSRSKFWTYFLWIQAE